MSLLQRVSPLEGADLEVPVEDAVQEPAIPLTLDHVISYDVLRPPPEEPALVIPHEAAYKVSNAKRIVQVGVAVLACWLASGIVFGFAALKPVLLAEGVYRDLCPIDEEVTAEEPCFEQDLRLNLFFTVASITTNVSALPVGTLVDRLGRRAGYVAGCIVMAAGCVLMGFAFAISTFDGYMVSNILIALGGTLIFVPSYQMANAFPKYSGVIVALVTGAFDASAAVYLLYKLAYDSSNGAFRPEYFFFGYAAVPVLILLAELTLMPGHDYHTMPELNQKLKKAQDAMSDYHVSDEEIDSERELLRIRNSRTERRIRRVSLIEDLIGDTEERKQRAVQETERHMTSGVWGLVHGLPVHRQMLTPWFLLLLILTALQMLRMNYFIATIDTQYNFMLDEVSSERINSAFDIALPVGGIVSTPFIGVLLDNLNEPTVLGLLTILMTLTGLFNCIPTAWAGYTTVVLFVIMRPLYYSAMSDYATKVFGFATFGRIYGAIICVSGLVNFSQAGLDALTLGPLAGNPTPVNAFLTIAAGIVGLTLTVSIWIKSRDTQQKQLEQELAGERERLIAEEDEEYNHG